MGKDKLGEGALPQVTSLSQLQEYAKGSVVVFPDFAPGQPFVARVRRPSMLALVKSGKIPNALLGSAQKLFSGDGKGNDEMDEKLLKETAQVIDIITEETLIEPSMEQLKELGMKLTDEQQIFLFNYTQLGVKALESFRPESKDSGNNQHGKNVQSKAK